MNNAPSQALKILWRWKVLVTFAGVVFAALILAKCHTLAPDRMVAGAVCSVVIAVIAVGIVYLAILWHCFERGPSNVRESKNMPVQATLTVAGVMALGSMAIGVSWWLEYRVLEPERPSGWLFTREGLIVAAVCAVVVLMIVGPLAGWGQRRQERV